MTDATATIKEKIRNCYADISHLTEDYAKAERYKERGDLKFSIADYKGRPARFHVSREVSTQ